MENAQADILVWRQHRAVLHFAESSKPSMLFLRDAQELEVLLLVERDGVADTLGEDRLEARAERRVRVTTGQVRLGHVRLRCSRIAEDRRPLLNLLLVVLRVEGGVPTSRAFSVFFSCGHREGLLTQFRARPASSGTRP